MKNTNTLANLEILKNDTKKFITEEDIMDIAFNTAVDLRIQEIEEKRYSRMREENYAELDRVIKNSLDISNISNEFSIYNFQYDREFEQTLREINAASFI